MFSSTMANFEMVKKYLFGNVNNSRHLKWIVFLLFILLQDIFISYLLPKIWHQLWPSVAKWEKKIHIKKQKSSIFLQMDSFFNWKSDLFSHGKTWDAKNCFGKVVFYILSGFVYPLALTKTMIETLPEGIQIALFFPFEVTKIFAHFQMEMFYNFKFCIIEEMTSE